MPRILIADDDATMRENLQEALTDEGFEIDLAINGAQAVEKVKAEKYDLLLLDLVMPGMSGMETLMLIKRENPQIKVVMMTAFSTVDNAVQAMHHGATDFMKKPFKIDDLVLALRQIFAESKFTDCKNITDSDEIFSALSNSVRRQIILILEAEGAYRFMDMTRKLEIADHTKVNFHLKILKNCGLVSQDEKKFYSLSVEGERIASCVINMMADTQG
jgi:DNA-binding NtrC family response regulator